jgi:hypothetical protein
MAADTNEISQILDTYHVNALLGMAKAAGLPLPGKGVPPKAVLVATMSASFFTRQRVEASLARIGRSERAILARLLLRGGSAPTRSLEREAVAAKLATRADPPESKRSYNMADYVPYAVGEYVGSPYRDGSRAFPDIMARLTLHGLVFSRFTGDSDDGQTFKLQFHPADELYVPEAVRRYLPEPEPVQEVAFAPPTMREGDPDPLLRDLYLYWDFVRRNPVPIIKSGYVSKRALRAINQQLLVPDPALNGAGGEKETKRLLLLRRLLQGLKLVQATWDELGLACGALEIPEFWDLPQERQLAACVAAWRQLGELHELEEDASACEPTYAKARDLLLRTLQARSAGAWVELAELVDAMVAADPNCLFSEYSRISNSRSSWYQSRGSAQFYGPPRSLRQKLDHYHVQFVQACLTGFLFQAGAVELGYEGERLVAARLSDLGRALLSPEQATQSQAPAPEAGRVVVQPSFQILAMGPVSLGVLARLDLFASRESVDRGAFQYRLSRESLYRGQQLGVNVGDVVRLLEATSGQELPQNVRRSLEEWAAHHERIVFRSGVTLVQTATPELLAELMAQPETAPYLARSVTPQVALAPGSAWEPLVDALVQRGLFPAVSGADPHTADHSVTIAEDGTIRPVHAVPSLHLRGRLARLAEESPERDGTWRLTPASVRRAAGNKARVLHLLDELGALHRGPLPERLVEQVRAWGGYYGDAAVETVTLIEFRDPEALDELRERPDLKGLLTPFPAGERALAAIPTGRLAEVKAILAGLGVRVRDGLA